ncbi:MAG: DUF2752 domain-containing protein [Deltaproteobacteria bacterium]|nr:DUF2752 domain-containing protein [Deltaproteobacteria bacterium]
MTSEATAVELAPPGPPVRAAALASQRRGTLGSRVAWFFFFIMPASVIGLSAWLTTARLDNTLHPLFGLPPCGFKLVTGLPCPGCGLTHSFTAMAHFDFVGAVLANPFGVILFLVSLTTIPLAALGFVRGWPVVDTLERLQFDKWAILLAITSVLVWIVRIVTLTLAS